jgi:TRAP-type C4-dicarboxylate transport system permease large subunit
MTAIACGVLLIIIGIAGYANGLMTERASLTALIPAVFGALLAVFGYIAGAKEDLRKHMMHAAAAVALIGFLLTAGRLLPRPPFYRRPQCLLSA